MGRRAVNRNTRRQKRALDENEGSPMKRLSEICRCWRCARTIPHRAEGHPRCDCGQDLTVAGAVSLCGDDLGRLDCDEFAAHVAARQALELRGR